MRILLLSFHFPPDSPLAATRAPKLARFLLRQGHDVRVLCAENPQATETQPLEIDPERVIRTPWRDLRAVPSDLMARFGLRGSAPKPPADPAPASAEAAPPAVDLPAIPPRPTLRNRLAQMYDASACKPDRHYGWRKPALEAAATLFQTWKPDVIYATCPPHSTALIAAQISQASDVPFVTEFRDRWAFDAYSDQPDWRRQWDKQKEHEVLSRASAIVTVSPLWAQGYARRYGEKKVTLSMNGFDPAQYPLVSPVEPNTDRDTLNLLYAGSLYPGRRDPRILFKGIAALGDGARDIHVTLMGKDCEPALQIAHEERVQKQVALLPMETHDQIIARQYAADALVLLQWNDPRDAGTVPGKLFEYIATRRPVIATGYSKGVTAQIVRSRDLGVFSNEPKVIANTLARLLAKKKAVGIVPALPEAVRNNATCDAQFAAIDPMLHEVAGLSPLQMAAE